METAELLEILLMVLMLYEARKCLNIMNEESRRRFWVSAENRDRDTKGFFALNFDKLYNNDSEKLKETIRMSKEVFDKLFGLVEEGLTKNSNRPSILPKCRLFLTLAYLANGGSRQKLSATFRMGLTTVKRIVDETCEVLWHVLAPIYLCPPQSAAWKQIAHDYYNVWDLPHCVGAIDGRQITYNYKGDNPMLFLAACDANYKFTCIGVEAYNCQSKTDGGLLWDTDFGQRLFNGQLGLPKDKTLPGTDIKFPYFMIGDATFPLKPCLMRPYPGTRLPADRALFNKRLERAHRVIENAFGILAARWGILQSPLTMSASSAEKVIKATVLLHNFSKMHDASYCPSEYVDHYQGDKIVKGLWRQEVSTPLQKHGRMAANNATKSAFKLRDDLMCYINSHSN